jgi:hypothetical protein
LAVAAASSAARWAFKASFFALASAFFAPFFDVGAVDSSMMLVLE